MSQPKFFKRSGSKPAITAEYYIAHNMNGRNYSGPERIQKKRAKVVKKSVKPGMVKISSKEMFRQMLLKRYATQ